jgi:hypothetical protein
MTDESAAQNKSVNDMKTEAKDAGNISIGMTQEAVDNVARPAFSARNLFWGM